MEQLPLHAIVVCPTCKQLLQIRKVTLGANKVRTGIAFCHCATYPLVQNILYFRRDKLCERAVSALENGHIAAATALLCQTRFRMWILLYFVLFSFVAKVFQRMLGKSLHRQIGLNHLLQLLTYAGFSKSWVWYLINRTRLPTYFMADAVSGVIKTGSTIIDMGCGIGQLFSLLRKKTTPRLIIGIDESFFSLLLARYFFYDPQSLLVCADMQSELPLHSNSIDTIFAVYCFHILHQKKTTLLLWKDLLKQTGILLLVHTLTVKQLPHVHIKGITPLALEQLLNNASMLHNRYVANSHIWSDIVQTKSVQLKEARHFIKTPYAFTCIASLQRPITHIPVLPKNNLLSLSDIEYAHEPQLRDISFNAYLNSFSHFYFISPHLDDAVLSCEALLRYLIKLKKQVSVMSVFTRGDTPAYSLPARQLLTLCGYHDAVTFFKDRQKEDMRALKSIGVRSIHLHYIDAAWRKANLFKNSWLQRYVQPSFFFRYASNELLFSGILHQEDESIVGELFQRLTRVIGKHSKTLVLAPVGFGNHVDHVLVHKAVSMLKQEKLYWQDMPYAHMTKVRKPKYFDEDLSITFSFPKVKTTSAIRFYKTYVKQQREFKKGGLRQSLEEQYYFKRAKPRALAPG